MPILLNCLPLAALLYLISTIVAIPVAEEKSYNSRKIITGPSSLKASLMKPSSTSLDRSSKKRIISSSDLPASPADFLRPDRFQFYTFDKTGEVITKQMTEQEIQSLIAAGGGNFSPMTIAIHEPQKAGEVSTGGTNVADVVQNVQNVLKSELNKPTPIISLIPTIPGHANAEWSNILPSIFSGDMETAPVHSYESINPQLQQEQKIPVIIGLSDYDEADEKPMIQVPVITIEEKPSVQNNSSIIDKKEENPANDDKSNGPIFQILNTISADQLKNDTINENNDQITGASEAINSSTVQSLIVNNQSSINNSFTDEDNGQIKENIISIVSETSSTSIKTPDKEEMEINNESIINPELITSTLEPIADDKFEMIQLMKPVQLNNTVTEPEYVASTLKTVETTVKDIIVTPTIASESVNETGHVTIELKDPDKNQVKDGDDETTTSEVRIVEFGTNENVTMKIDRVPETTTEEMKRQEASTVVPLESAESMLTTSSALTEKLSTQETSTTESFSLSSTTESEVIKSPIIVSSSTEAAHSKNEQSVKMTTEESTEAPLSMELEDSLSSMISQISEAMKKPSAVSPLNDKLLNNTDEEVSIEDSKNEETSSVKYTTESSFLTNQSVTEFLTIESKIPIVVDFGNVKNETKSMNSSDIKEAPIVRIDIMETKPTTEFLQLNATIEQYNYTESPVVRIQLTDAVSTVNRIIESQSNINNGVTPNIEHLTLPPIGSVNANGIASSLIAGLPNNQSNEDNFDLDDDSISIDLAKKGVKPVEETEPMIMKELPEKIDNLVDQMNFSMEKINLNQLPIVNYKKNTANSLVKNQTKIESQVFLSQNHNSDDNKMNNEEKRDETLINTENLMSNKSMIMENNKVDKNEIEGNQTIDVPIIRIDDYAELPTEYFIPTPIKLTDLPLVQKLTKSKIKNNSLAPKNNSSKIDKKPIINHEETKNINNTYHDDPYEKLGEPIESSDASQVNNSTLKSKDHKKDSSMEKLGLQKLPVSIDQDLSTFPVSTPKSTEIVSITLPSTVKNTSKENEPEKWTLIPQKLPHAPSKTDVHSQHQNATISTTETINHQQSVSLDHLKTVDGLDSSVKNLQPDITYFSNLCNDLAFSFWSSTNQGLSSARSLVLSPFGMTSMLAMIFLGARGSTSDQMNNLLKLDDVASFNPHLIFQNVTDSVGSSRKQGIANAAFVREVFADRMKIRKLLPFYKEQAQQFYDGVVAEVNFATISDLVRRRTNLMIRKQTGGRIKDFVRGNTVPMRSPLAALSANVFQTDCNNSYASSDGRDGELYFAVSPAIRQRKLIPVPSTVWRAGIFAGYEPILDATAIALGGVDKLISTIFVIPGQQGFTAPGDNLELLEERLMKGATHDGAWNKLLKVVIPRPGLELQVPKFSHRSVINATASLKRMGLHDLFEKHANLKGINGFGSDLHLTDVLQMNLFSTCGDENILSGRHHVEVYPASPQRNARSSIETPRKLHRDKSSEQLLSSRPTIKLTDNVDRPRLKLDRPFLYFVRHNPTGLILHMGRFNPRLLP